VEGSIRLYLLGKPNLVINGEVQQIEPRLPFMVAAKIVLAGESGITRTKLTGMFWGHLEANHARQQLRVALHRLRHELERLGVANRFNLGEELLSVKGHIPTDLDELKRRATPTFEAMESLLQPFAVGWNGEFWQSERDEVAELTANAFVHLPHQHGRDPRLLGLLKQAVALYPSCTRLNQLYVQALKENSREAEANEAIIAFEDHWVDRFGHTDIPNLSEGIHLRQPPESTPFHRLAFAFVPALCLLFVLAGSILPPASQPTLMKKLLTQRVPGSSLDIEGTRCKVAHLVLPRGSLEGFQVTSNGGLVAEWTGDSKLHHFDWRANQLEEVPESGDRIRDVSDTAWVADSPDASYFDLHNDQGTSRIYGTKELPLIYPIGFVNGSDLLFHRASADRFVTHLHLCLLSQGRETAIDQLIGPEQTGTYTAITSEAIYAKASLGPSTHWHYQTFRYSLKNHTAQILPPYPVKGVSSKGALALVPEVTEVKLGDTNTHWDGTVDIVQPDGSKTHLSYEGQDKFYDVVWFKDFLILARSDHWGKHLYVALDFNGVEVPQLTSIVKDALVIQQAMRGDGVLIKTEDSEYTTVTAR
jgi:hypothetical protein